MCLLLIILKDAGMFDIRLNRNSAYCKILKIFFNLLAAGTSVVHANPKGFKIFYSGLDF